MPRSHGLRNEDKKRSVVGRCGDNGSTTMSIHRLSSNFMYVPFI